MRHKLVMEITVNTEGLADVDAVATALVDEIAGFGFDTEDDEGDGIACTIADVEWKP